MPSDSSATSVRVPPPPHRSCHRHALDSLHRAPKVLSLDGGSGGDRQVSHDLPLALPFGGRSQASVIAAHTTMQPAGICIDTQSCSEVSLLCVP
jgi:hypothetical protein